MEEELKQLSQLIENAKRIDTDWSGVVSDDRFPVYEANMRIMDDYGLPRITFEQWINLCGHNPMDFCIKVGICGEEEKIYSIYGNHLNDVVREGKIKPKIYSGAKEALEYLFNQGKELNILSSHPKENLINESIEYGVNTCFSDIEGGCKDKIEGLGKICENGGNNRLYIGDMTQDADAAIKNNINFLAVCCGYHPKKAHDEDKQLKGRDYLVIDDLATIMEIERTKLK